MALNAKTKAWLANECPRSMEKKTLLITGGNSGIGYKTAEIWLYQGGDVILACRNKEKAEEAKKVLKKKYPQRSVRTLQLDLASFSSIDRFALELQNQKIEIDCFVNNAGVFRQPHKTTEDGFELVMGTNYLGTYRLCEKVLPYLETLGHPVTVINTVSIIHKLANLKYSDFYCKKQYGNFKIYAKSKLALAVYTQALVRRYQDSSIRICMNHPGMSLTPIGLKAYGKTVYKIGNAFRFLLNSAEKSALSTAYIMNHDIKSGSVIGPRGFINGWGYPAQNRICQKTLKGADELISFTEKEMAGRK